MEYWKFLFLLTFTPVASGTTPMMTATVITITESITDITSKTESATDMASITEGMTDITTMKEGITDMMSTKESMTDMASKTEGMTDMTSRTESITDTTSITESMTDMISKTESKTDMTSKTESMTDMISITESMTDMISKTEGMTDMTSTKTIVSGMTSEKVPTTSVTSKTDHSSITTPEPITDGDITSIETDVITDEVSTTLAVTEGTTKVIIPTEFITTRRTEPPPFAGPLPSTEYPQVEDESAEKKIRVTIKVTNAPQDCTQDNCTDFEDDFKNAVSKSYARVKGFSDVQIIEWIPTLIKDTTLYVEHEAIYIWNDMNANERGLTASQIYDQTVADDIRNGQIGNISVTTCEECQPPQENTIICADAEDVQCEETFYLEPACNDGLPVCQSMCLNTADPYCERNIGICTQKSKSEPPKCSCLQASESFYFGDRCQWSLEKLWVYVGLGAAAFIIVLLITVLCVCVVSVRRKNRKLSRDRRNTSDSAEEVLGIHSYGITNEVYDPSNPDGEMYMKKHDAFFDVPPLDSPLDDTFPQEPTYTFGVTPVTSANASRVNSIDRRDDPSFWGNLCDDFNKTYTTEMQPVSSPQTQA